MYIKVKVTPDAKKESFLKKSEDTFLVSVREPAEQNQANKAVLALVAIHFKIPASRIKVISGHHHRHKILSVEL